MVQTKFVFPGLELDETKHEVVVGTKPVELTVKEFNLLMFLAKNQGQFFNRQQLLGMLWGDNAGINGRTIDVHIRRIRQKLGEKGAYLKTLHGLGYKFKPIN